MDLKSKVRKRQPWDEIDPETGEPLQDIPGVSYPSEFQAAEDIGIAAATGGASFGPKMLAKQVAKKAAGEAVRNEVAKTKPTYSQAGGPEGSGEKFADFIRSSEAKPALQKMEMPTATPAAAKPAPTRTRQLDSRVDTMVKDEGRLSVQQLQDKMAATDNYQEKKAILEQIRQLRDQRIK